MQAKFFEKLGSSQWRQIDKSAKTALQQHPDLSEYHIYVPLDRTQGRSGKKKTSGQIERWNEYVKSWHQLPHGSGVKFVWCGRFEIETALKNPQNFDLLYYWFGTHLFDDTWQDRPLQASLKTLGERYQPNRHVDANVGYELDRFVWSPSSHRSLEDRYSAFAEACLSFTQLLGHLALPDLHGDCIDLVRKAIDEVVRVEYPSYGVKQVEQVLGPARKLLGLVYKLSSALNDQQKKVSPNGTNFLGTESTLSPVRSMIGSIHLGITAMPILNSPSS